MKGTLDWLESLAPNEETAAAAARPSTLEDFLREDVATDRGAWSLEGHEPFRDILLLMETIVSRPVPDAEISLLKAEQIGATTSIGLGPALHLVADRGWNVGYFLPTDKFAHKLGRTRLKRIVAKSQYLSELMRDHRAVNQAALKELNDHFFYLLGLESMLGAVSIPLDVLMNDEVDLLPEENKEWSQGRIAHSQLRFTVNLSAGYSPGAGIDLHYQDGTQHRWLVDCANRRCREKEICLEEVFPDCLAEIDGHYVRVCPSCLHPLDVVKNGRWVGLYPAKEKKRRWSFRLSALAVAAMSGDYIWNRWERAKRSKTKMAKFRCSVLAIPDAGAMQPVTDAELEAMKLRAEQIRVQGTFPRFAGMDTGDLCHFVCYERLPGGNPRIVHMEEIDSDVAEGRVATLLANLGVRQLVIDKKPLTTLARALAYRFPRIVAVQDFTDAAEMKLVEETHQHNTYRCVKVQRDESLDELTSEITDPSMGLILPEVSGWPIEEFEQHLKNLRKDREIDAKGRVVDRYKKGVANHFGMALNSARLAEVIVPPAIKFEFHSAGVSSRYDGSTAGGMGGVL